MQSKNILHKVLELILSGGSVGWWKILFLIILIVSRTGTFVNKFSTSREDIIPLFGLWVLRISISFFYRFEAIIMGKAWCN